MKFIAACCLAVLSMGCSISGSTHVHRTFGEGQADVYSKARVRDGTARFRCIDSGTGQCHYTVYSAACGASDGTEPSACPRGPLARFTLAEGETRDLAAAERFRICVRTDAVLPDPDCRVLELSAAQ
ncbi:hypothetical protein GCM10007067_25470 [Lysobacter bugurensis]|uniref:Uncharacterized protein n=1 Tax=Cognatilysobacter bugurensis TaxID=543356 RepID=A0A918WAP6_9GAMM|nr:hypothetical protein GCM10007067_25470 [Lysobacter bugurensis]